MKIAFFVGMNRYWEEYIGKLKDLYPDVDFVHTEEDKMRKRAITDADGIVTGRLKEKELDRAKNLKILFVPFTGVNFFPLEGLKSRGIIIANSHGNSRSVAERALSLCLCLLGRIVEYHNDLRKGIWHRYEGKKGRWTTLYEKDCGILGAGHIGRDLAKLLKSFNCKVIGLKKHPHDLPNFARVTDDLNYVIDNSQIIFITLPSTPETEGLIDREKIQKMKNKYIINVSRGSIVKEEDLYYGLKSGILKGAGLDVWYRYPGKDDEPFYPSELPVYELSNVVITPHNASNTEESRKNNIYDTFKNIESYLETGKPLFIVNPDLMY